MKCKLYLSSLRHFFLAGSMDSASKSAFIARQTQWASHGGSRVKLCPNCQLHPLTDTRVFGRSRCYPPEAARVTDRLSDRTTREMWSASSPAPSCWPRSLAEILGMTLRSTSSSAKHVRRWREEHGKDMNRLESKITCEVRLYGQYHHGHLASCWTLILYKSMANLKNIALCMIPKTVPVSKVKSVQCLTSSPRAELESRAACHDKDPLHQLSFFILANRLANTIVLVP